jgi:hypothetical protein
MEHAPGQFNLSMREWGRRHLSFSGDWANRFRGKSRSRSITRNSVAQRPQPQPSRSLLRIFNTDGELSLINYILSTYIHRHLTGGNKEFPSKNSSKKEHFRPHCIATTPTESNNPSFSTTRQNDTASHITSRSPGGRYYQHHTRTMAPMSSLRSRQVVQRSNSQGGHGSPVHLTAPRSAKRWARTAHLHEVKQDSRTRSPRMSKRDLTPVRDDVLFSAPATVPRTPFTRVRRDLTIMTDALKDKDGQLLDSTPLRNKVGDGDPWEDTDFDMGESEEDVEREHKVDTVRASPVSVSGKEH